MVAVFNISSSLLEYKYHLSHSHTRDINKCAAADIEFILEWLATEGVIEVIALLG